MILWFLRLVGLEDGWTLEFMGVSIVLETLIILDGIWFLLLISDAVNDYYLKRRLKRGRTKKNT